MKKVLITGGTGFLGKRLGIRFKDMGYDVVLTARNNKQNFYAEKITGCEICPVDVTNIESIRDALNEYNPDVMIHAAATKFVDLSEKFPMEAIDINVRGSQNVARAAIDHGIKVVLGISTDKAAPPVRNTYGMTKSLMERMFCSLDGKTDTRFVCVRYGNVAWSTGSVLCIWKKMIEEQGEIGTTGPGMTRFFFTVDEAVELVKTAFDNYQALAGKVLSRTMKSAKLENICKIWTAMTNTKYKKLPERPGERNEEFLIGDLELPYTSEKIFNDIKHFIIDFNKKVPVPLEVGLSSDNAVRLNEEEIKAILNNPPEEEVS